MDESTYADYAKTLDLYVIDDTIPSFDAYTQGKPASYPDTSITISAGDFIRYETPNSAAVPDVSLNYENNPGVSVYTDEDALIQYIIDVPADGWYSPALEYYPVSGKNASIQRALFVDGRLPCREFARVEFARFWRSSVPLNDDTGTYIWEKDNQGNDRRPAMVESPEWTLSDFLDADGYVTQPLRVFLEKGKHIITLYSIREPMLIRRIVFNPVDDSHTVTYAEYKRRWDEAGAKDAVGAPVIIQAEDTVRTSSQMLYPMQELGSPSVTPSSAKLLLINTIGGNSWRFAGQWIEWDFYAPSDGYYNISMHVNQNLKRGIYVSRKIMIDGAVPFAELADYPFTYAQDWRQVTLSNTTGEPYRIYLTAGKHTLRMEATLGGFSAIIASVRDAVYQLNAIYRQVIQLTGVAPDRFRDYQIERSLPLLTGQMESVRDSLTEVIDRLRADAGSSSDRERALVTMRDQLDTLIEDNERYGRVIADFKKNVRACGTWLNEAMLQPLQLDDITIKSPETKLAAPGIPFLTKASFEVRRLMYSFVIDYNAIGNVTQDERTITLWVGSGRDQANVIKTLIDDTFTSETGVNVNVMLVDMSTLLQATLAGQGPDVAIQVGWDLPMNYGQRGAVLDLSQFSDIGEIRQRFASGAMVPYEFDGHIYALPETQVFPMLFYRKDIMAQMGQKIPETWDDVAVMLATLARSQMEIGMIPSENIFAMILYQNGGRYYNQDATRSALVDEEAIQAFKLYTEFYTDYKLDRVTSVEERFRTGECPMVIADYTVYNNLQVSAPDLRGLWGMAPVPGTRRDDGSIDRSVGGNGSACVVMRDTDQPEISWEFLKWWTSAETQIAYGREMESLMGASARVPTANLEAFDHMPWPTADLAALKEQQSWAKGIPQVPGGYFTYRNINNAFYSVTTPPLDQLQPLSVTPREALTDKVILINDEIRYKRTEFGLPLDPD
ncbi:ABC transporter substrate-binding protein [Clostridia bacterium]|nr:ABC transporter substrate-binding protein [Clostridia bacterium]